MTENNFKIEFNETCILYFIVISSVSLVFGKGREILLKESILDWHHVCFVFLVSHLIAIPD